MKQNFSFTAISNGQTVFGPIVPASMPQSMVALQGIVQDIVNGDFTVSGQYYINLNTGVSIGTRVHGELDL